MTDKKKEELEKDIYFKFSRRFLEIAKLADKGDDKGYGKKLASIEIGITKYLLSVIDQLIQEKVEKIEKLSTFQEKYPDGAIGSPKLEKSEVLTILKE